MSSANSSALEMSKCKNKKGFVFYNQLHFKKIPNLLDFGLKPISFIYGAQLWKDRVKRDTLDSKYLINNYHKKKLLGNSNILCLDIEHWPIRRVDEKQLNKTIANFSAVIQLFRTIYPDVKIGIFEYGPPSFYPLYDQFANGNVENKLYKAWQQEMERIKPITDQVDILFPQLYSRWPGNIDGWERCAREALKHSRVIAAGRPVIPVLCPQYWLRDKTSPIINGYEWDIMLKTTHELADSVVFWSISKTATNWESNAEWWLKTKQFVADANIC